MSLKSLADKVLERNHSRNQDGTGDGNRVAGGDFSATSHATGEVVRQAVEGYGITPRQFLALCPPDDLADIEAGLIPVEHLRWYAESLAAGIQSGRIAFHPASGAQVRHGVCERDQVHK